MMLAVRERQAGPSFYRTPEEHEERATAGRGCPRICWGSCVAAVSRAFVVWRVAVEEDLVPTPLQRMAFAFASEFEMLVSGFGAFDLNEHMCILQQLSRGLLAEVESDCGTARARRTGACLAALSHKPKPHNQSIID